MDVRRKQLLSYECRLLSFGLRVACFRPRHLNRSMPRGKMKRIDGRTDKNTGRAFR